MKTDIAIDHHSCALLVADFVLVALAYVPFVCLGWAIDFAFHATVDMLCHVVGVVKRVEGDEPEETSEEPPESAEEMCRNIARILEKVSADVAEIHRDVAEIHRDVSVIEVQLDKSNRLIGELEESYEDINRRIGELDEAFGIIRGLEEKEDEDVVQSIEEPLSVDDLLRKTVIDAIKKDGFAPAKIDGSRSSKYYDVHTNKMITYGGAKREGRKYAFYQKTLWSEDPRLCGVVRICGTPNSRLLKNCMETLGLTKFDNDTSVTDSPPKPAVKTRQRVRFAESESEGSASEE